MIMPFPPISKPDPLSGEGCTAGPSDPTYRISSAHSSGWIVVRRARSRERFFRADSRQGGTGWTYAPRPAARPVTSTAAPPPGRRTMRISPCLPPTSRQPTQVLAGSFRSWFMSRLVRFARFDVDPEAGQPGGQPRVLPVASDGQRQLAARHENGRGPGGAVDGDRVCLGGTE